MRQTKRTIKTGRIVWLLAGSILMAACAFAQAPPPAYPPPPSYRPAELDRLVSRIALYPDPLIAQILAAATFPIRFRKLRAGQTSTTISQAMH